LPEKFDKCVSAGGRVRTVTPKKGTYIHICYPKGGGSPIQGEVRKSEKKK